MNINKEETLTPLSDEELLRYSRQILLPQVDIEGQKKLANAKILVLGCGGLGCASTPYLAGAGVGAIHLMDFDAVESSNLHRQISFSESDIGVNKAEALAKKLSHLNRFISVTYTKEKAEQSNFCEAAQACDLIVDGSDNFETRFMVNRIAFELGIPLVSAAAIGLQGQITTLDPREDSNPCYRCLYPEQAREQQDSCHERGVLGPLVGLIGSMQALETLKVLLGMGDQLVGSLLLVDGETWQHRRLSYSKDAQCPACS